MSALWGELAASVAVDAASRRVELDLHVDDQAVEPSGDPAKAMRVYRNLTLAALRLTARDACLRVRVQASHARFDETDDDLQIVLESVCPGSEQGRARLYRALHSVPSEAGFALQAARAYLRPLGGAVEALFMQDLGVRIALRVPRRARTSDAGVR